ncbi:MAG: dTMP kinase [Deltaproteobacteria bacterium]|nr:dTMP kinase [Deltaproteobacteria bacterium]
MIRFISFEGGDGSGKTTQLKLLEGYLASQGEVCRSTREPGGTSLGRMLRKVLLEVGKKEISSPTELFLYLADRAQHVREIIGPALERGMLVLCDRFSDSTLAYQGYGRGIDLDLLRRLNQLASRAINPDLTFLLDCPVEVGLARIREQLKSIGPTDKSAKNEGRTGQDRFEQEEMEFHERVRRGFLELAHLEPRRFCVLDASRPVRQVHDQIKRLVDRRLRER